MEFYFVAKCSDISKLHRAKYEEIWACPERKTTPQPSAVLSEAFNRGAVYLIFSVNNCHGWHGVAKMLTKPGDVSLSSTVGKNETSVREKVTESGQDLHGNVSGGSGVNCSSANSGVGTGICQQDQAMRETQDIKQQDMDRGLSLSNKTKEPQPLDYQKEHIRATGTLDTTTDDLDACAIDCENNVKGKQPASNASSSTDADHAIKWHAFRIEWQILYLREHGEQCLPFTHTETLTTCSGGVPVNKSRNLQAVDPLTGKLLWDLMKIHYQELSEEKIFKETLKKKKVGDPFFEPQAENDPDPVQVWKQLLQKVQKMGKVLLACAYGSQRYNLHTPASDMDMFVVYAAETKDVLGFKPPKPTIQSRDSESCDYTIHEVHRYCELLLAGDPRCVETLFLHPFTVYHVSEQWRELCKHRQMFLNRRCLEKYLRDATGSKGLMQLDKWVSSGQTEHTPVPSKICKLLYVILRLLQNARNIAGLDELQVYRTKGSTEWNLLMDIRNGKLEYDIAREHIDRLLQETKDMQQEKAEQLAPNQEHLQHVVECWLLLIRYQNLKSYMESKIQNMR